MKKIIVALVLFLCFGTVVSASSINGDYKGNPIVKLISNGKVIDPGEVPAMIFEGKTMVPISALRNLGVEVTWIPDNYSVNASLPLPDTFNNPDETVNRVLTFAKQVGGKNTNLIYDEYGSYLSIRLDSTGDSTKDADTIMKLASLVGITSSQESRINYYVNNVYSAEIVSSYADADLWINKKLTNDQYSNRLKITQKSTQTAVPNVSVPTPQASPNAPSTKDAPLLYSNDGKTYLGKLTTDTFDKDSVLNEYGTYGSKFQTKSIWNEFGIYGSEFSDTSAFNDLASKPPMILQNGKVIGYLTTNKLTPGAISPFGLEAVIKKMGF